MPLCAHLMSKLNAKEEKFGDNWTQEGCLFFGRWWAVDGLIRSAYDDLYMVQQLHAFLLKHLREVFPSWWTLPILCRCWTHRATVWIETRTSSSTMLCGKGREGAQIFAVILCRGFIFHGRLVVKVTAWSHSPRCVGLWAGLMDRCLHFALCSVSKIVPRMQRVLFGGCQSHYPKLITHPHVLEPMKATQCFFSWTLCCVFLPDFFDSESWIPAFGKMQDQIRAEVTEYHVWSCGTNMLQVTLITMQDLGRK